MKTTLKVNLIIDDKTSGVEKSGDCVIGNKTSHKTLKRLIDSGKFKSEYIPPYLDNREPIIIITEV